ncbi:MAG TPA: His/Gly/Thr/Pro-type tRNA ligase C-terminal domain-containing protein [Candidatus Magasanikbacteria bacterium]|nr:His/Gly/Thr/Pro-type tRNA ligase C-terminal domain-containing protein [Candidatus Magasanikbacteria bacterium]
MKQSKLFTTTAKNVPKDEVSLNSAFLLRAGYIDKLAAGIYTYLPLGLRVLNNIKNIIREEMNAIGALEILMPALQPKENWVTTGRWDDLDVLFKLKGAGDKDFALGATHEEVVTPLLRNFVNSYKDLPVAVYQIQDKFRNETRAKSGLLRGREFLMKDLYSFHATVEDLDAYYETVIGAYNKIFTRLGLAAMVVESSGGTFSKFSHEFQVFIENGEDDVYACVCGRHQNSELVPDGSLKCPYCGAEREVRKATEVGNIFKLMTKYSGAFENKFTNQDGVQETVLMGCYGIGPSRVMGTIVEVSHDDAGIIWPEAVAPYKFHLISLAKTPEEEEQIEKIYQTLGAKMTLYDDRSDARAGEKFADADLLGLPWRIVASSRTLADGAIELRHRIDGTTELLKLADFYTRFEVKR